MVVSRETFSVKNEDIIELEGFKNEIQRFKFHFQTSEDDPIDKSIVPRLLTDDDERVPSRRIKDEGLYQITGQQLTFIPDRDFIGIGQGVIFHAITKSGTNISVHYIPNIIEKVEEEVVNRDPNKTYLTVEYQNLQGEQIAEDYHLALENGDYYAVLPLQLADYEVLDEDVMSGVISQFDLKQTYFYQPLRQSQVILQYLDQVGRDIVPKVVLTSQVGDAYRAKPKEFDEYDYVSTVGEIEGKFTDQVNIVTFNYKKSTHATLIIKFLDVKGNPLLEELSYRLKIGDQYKSHPRKVTGYKVIEKPENADGTIKPGVTTIIYTYHTRTNAKVIVKYVDEEDNLVIPSTTLTGAVGDPYQVEQRLIPTYDFVRFEGDIEGEFTDEIITVKCIYRLMNYR